MDTTYAFIGMLTILFMGSVLSKEAFTDGQVTVSVTMPSCDSDTTQTPEYDINYSDTTNHINYSDLTNNMYSDSRTTISVTDLMGMANSSCQQGSIPPAIVTARTPAPARGPGTGPSTAPAPGRTPAPSTAAFTDYESSGSFGDSGKYCESDSQCINSCDFTSSSRMIT